MNTISNDLNILISSIQNIENKTKESFSNSSNIIENIPAKLDYISFYSQNFIYEELLEILNQIDISNITTMAGMFFGCNNLTTIPELNTSNVTTMAYMFQNCTNLTTIPNFNTSNVSDMKYMFYHCQNLINIPNLDTSNVTDMTEMFYNCINLVNIPELNTSNVTDMIYMFYNCINLVNIPEFNFSKVNTLYHFVFNCNNLSYTSIKNVINTRYTSSNTELNLMHTGLSIHQLYYYLTPNDINDYVSKGYTGGKSKTTNLPIVNTSKISTSGLELRYIYNINTTTKASTFINEVMNLPHMSPEGDLNANQYELIKFLPKYTNMNIDRNIDVNNSSFKDSYGAIYLDVEGGMGGRIYYALQFTAINIDDPNCNNYENWDAYSNAHFSHTFAQVSKYSANNAIGDYWVDMNVNIPDWVGRIGYINSDFKNSYIGRYLVLNWYNVN